jgi:hypothetical protein
MFTARRLGWKACVAGAACAFGIALAAPPGTTKDCPDTNNSCERPVKFIVKGSCLVYACQYGTPKVRLIRVNPTDKQAKQALDKLAADKTK